MLGMMKGTFSVPSYTRTVYPGRGRGRLPEEETQMRLPSPAVVLEPTVLGVGGCRWAVLLGRGRRVGGTWDRQGMRLKKGVPRYTGSGASGAERKSELSDMKQVRHPPVLLLTISRSPELEVPMCRR